jgi:hypothetical protein
MTEQIARYGNEGKEDVATYWFDDKQYVVEGHWSIVNEGNYDFFDLYDGDGQCLNEGNPYYELPTEVEVEAIHKELVEDKYYCIGCDRADHSNYDKCGGCSIAG